MPSYKKSLGIIEIRTPETKAFHDYIVAELRNLMAWNKEYIKFDGKSFTFKNLWKITPTRTGFIAESKEPVIYLRHGVKIFMGSSRIEIS